MDVRDGRIYELPGKFEELQHHISKGKLEELGLIKRDLNYLKEMGYDPTPVQRARKKVGRNETCPCGSGIKFKKCCLFGAK